MKNIIAINREYGSGGRIIGKLVAEKLDVPYYDKELLHMTAEKSGFTEEFVKEATEKKTTSLLYSLYMTSLPISDQLFLAQSQVIKEISEKGASVIVGGCSEYVLKDHKNCVTVFIHAPLEDRIKRVRDEYKEYADDFRSYVMKHDKKRIAHYTYFTQNKWGYARDYHLAVDSSAGVEAAADIICAFAKAYKR